MNDAKLSQALALLEAALSVHDYVGRDQATVLALVHQFRDRVRQLLM